jgi:hypothetical protein
MAEVYVDLNCTAAEIDASVLAYINYSIDASRNDVDTTGYTDPTMDNLQKVANVVDADHAILNVIEEEIPNLLNLDQITPQTIINGVPLLSSTRIIESDNQIIDKKYADTVQSGGMKSFFFTKTASDVAGMYKAITTLPTGGVQTITGSALDGETIIASFITDTTVSPYRVIEGSRFFYFTARVSSTAKPTQLKGYIYETDVNGVNPVLLRSSSLSKSLTAVDAEYSTSVWGTSLNIPITTRIKFVIAVVKTGTGADPIVTLSTEDDTFSRLDVPSPTGVTDLTGYISGAGTTGYIPVRNGSTTVEDSIISQSATNIDIAGTLSYTGKLVQRIIVGTKGHFTTVKAAVDYFNANAASNTEILIDGGIHAVADTITVNDSTHELQIRGLGSNVTKLQAATGLLNKPMFVFKTPCSINKVSLIGSTLSTYGTHAGENAINYDALNAMYSEVTDIIIDTFNIGVYDTIGTNLFLYNFVIDNCVVAGYRINTTGSNAYFDCEVGSFYNNGISIDLLKANTGGFLIDTLTFDNVGAQTAIKYTGGTGNFINAGVCQITGCSYNNVGTFVSGFDFTLASGRDANIIVLYNTGTENKNPHAKINVLNNASTTTITNPATFYKAVYTNTSSYTCKFTIADNRVTYQPTNARDVMMWVSCNVISTQTNRNVDIAIVKNGNTALGLFGQMTCRISTASVPFTISTNVYLPDVTATDYYEVWVTNSGTGNVVVQDLSWLIDSK